MVTLTAILVLLSSASKRECSKTLNDLTKVTRVEVEELEFEPRQMGTLCCAFQLLTWYLARLTWDLILFLPLTACVPRLAIIFNL